ncbi:MAG: (d)CMP kinase [Saprospiraceae bacterium]
MKKIIITIDGHSACGKSTLAKALANELNYGYIDTGAMYRAVTFYFLENRVNIQKTAEMEKALKRINITFKNTVGGNRTYLNGKDVEDVIRKMFVSKNVSHVAAISTVRKMVVKQQIEMGKLKGIVMEGRDIGTVVFPKAELKIFLTADEEVRVNRRYDELIKKGQKVSIKSIKDNLRERDHIDSTRKDSPLKKANEAVLIDNSNITQKEQLAMVLGLSTERVRRLSVVDKKIVSSKPKPQKTTRLTASKSANQPISKNQKSTKKSTTQNQTNKKPVAQKTKPNTQKRTNQPTSNKQRVAQKNANQNQPNKKTTNQNTKPNPQKRTNQPASNKPKVAQKNTNQNQPNKKTTTQNTKPNPQKRTNQPNPKNQNSAQQSFLKIQTEEKPVERKKKTAPKRETKQSAKKVVQQKTKSTPTTKKKTNKPTPKTPKKVQPKSTSETSTEVKKKKVRTKRKNKS